MKIIQVHNYYQLPGGEDTVVESELKLLRSNGHEVITYYKNNDGIHGFLQLLSSSLKTFWNKETYKEFRSLLRREKPDVIHCHNTFPLISPSVYWAAAKENIPVVQTLHNYRLLCLNSQLFRPAALAEEGDGVCEKCLKRSLKWPGVRYACYRGSVMGSMIVAAMIAFHKVLGTWSSKVSMYIALTDFQKQKMVEGGIPTEKIIVKPNFMEAGIPHESIKKQAEAESYALFVGRLSPEKGVRVLLDAWHQLMEGENGLSGRKLIIVGDGPQKKELELYSSALGMDHHVRFLGQKSRSDVGSLMRSAGFLVFPSLWYETFGLTVLEAGMLGIPSIISSPTTTASLIDDGVSGICFERGNAADLAEKISWAFFHSDECSDIGKAAVKQFSENFSSDVNERLLTSIYKTVSSSV